jgi:hypothetical protein
VNGRRAAAVVVVALVALSALLAWWLLRDGADALAPAPHVDPPAPPVTEAPPPVVAPQKRTRAPAETPTEGAPAGPVEEPDGAPLFPAVAVEVCHADGSPAPRATVFARRADASADDAPAASARLDRAATCVLYLPEPGVYDIGADADDEFVSALATGVDVRTTSRVKLELPEPAAIELDADETIPRGGLARLRIVSDDGSTRDRGFRAAQLPITFSARPGARFRLRSASPDVHFVPDRVAAPGSATLRRDGRGKIRLLVTVVPADRVARHDALLRTEFEIEGGGASDAWDELSREWIVAAGTGLADAFRSRPEWVVSAPSPRGTLRWRGAGIASGSVGFEAPDGETVDVPVTLRLDDTLPGEAECLVTVEGPANASNVQLWLLAPDRNESAGQPGKIGAQTVVAPPAWPSALVYATADGLVSAAAAFDPQLPITLPLRPAGRVGVARSVRPPHGVDLVLRRKDGGPMPCGDGLGPEWQVVSLRLRDLAHVVVGPLPAGDVTFVVSYGGLDLAEVTARVAPDTTTEVTLPFAQRLAALKR